MGRRDKGGKTRRGLTRAELSDVVYELHGGLTRQEASEVVEVILGTVKTSLLDGRPVKIQNFGVFEVTERQGRAGINPSSGEKIYIPAHKGLSFRPSKKLKRLLQRRRQERDSQPGGE
ncbi:MAG: integration host factor subunit beta [Acidobacteria bacterium]|nr:MAG: integration host factor subunit beta [Acidobacteriota bacterium]